MGSSHVAVVGAVLVAAILHASWNALLKDGRDRLAMVVLLDLTAMALSALLLPLATSPRFTSATDAVSIQARNAAASGASGASSGAEA